MSPRPDRRIGLVPGALLIAAALVLGACGPASDRSSEASAVASMDGSSTSVPIASSTTTSATTTIPTTTAPAPVASPSTRERLAVLAIDDRPSPQGVYRREEWPHWADIDGNGCDARQDALSAWSTVPATVNRSGTCKVLAGAWVSPYDQKASNNPGDFDVDHLVPLENAFRSGGWAWSTARRRAYANDPGVLVVASASSNRSKGSDPPDQWRPSFRDSWCAYADGWVRVKSTWGLTVTTSERDALGQMLDTCGIAGPVWPLGGAVFTAPSGAVPSGPAPSIAAPAAPAEPTPGGEVYYATCAAARAAGAAPIRAGQPGYRAALDGDKDGVACE